MSNFTIDFSSLAKKLDKYFRLESPRKLPWRNGNPYHVLVSEFMLQQTRSETVIPYFQNWIKSFPDIHSVAIADPDFVLKHWEKLGYYNRCRNLKRTCEIIDEKFNGKIPNDFSELRSLPGVGDYTAGALLAIIHGLPFPAVDGNHKRVLARILGYADRIDTAKAKNLFSATNLSLMEFANPATIIQSLMDLGSTICVRTNPKCESCPVQMFCSAYKNLNVGKIPLISPKPIPENQICHYRILGYTVL